MLLSGCASNQELVSDLPCVEVGKWKYQDYTAKAFFPNQIFAKGFSVNVQFIKRKRNQADTKKIRDDIVNAFRSALTLWGVSLIMIQKELPAELNGYIKDNTFYKVGSSTYNPPMVFAVDCPEDANFVIKVFLNKTGKFPGKRKDLALAQISGRTIMLNMHRNKLVYDQQFFSVSDEQKVYFNLVSVLSHELGHSFGLAHTTLDPSIMNPSIWHIPYVPTKDDGRQFARILDSVITGGTAGYFSPKECTGLHR